NAPCEVLVPSATNGGSNLKIGEWTNVTPPPNSTSWISGNQGVGYEKSSSNLYDDYFNLDIESQMASKNGSCYIRIPFTISSQAELDSLESLTLKMRYDDSFVAFINGAEVSKDSNAPSDLAWDSIAEGSHDDDEAIEYVPYSISGGGNLLRVGENILAIQGLNRGRGSNDALWSCLLSASRGGGDAVSANALVYSSAINLDKSVDVRARSFDGFKWSPLSQAGFVVSAVPASVENLVISEIHYRPASPSSGETSVGFDSRGDFEFIELLNIDPDQAINLEGISFVDGIDFAGFDNSLPLRARILGPGERVLLVGNQAGFELRYGSANIAGEYDGSLKNEGEQIVLLDAGGFSIRDFTYGVEFPWPEAAGDGSGFSLVLNDAVSNPDHSQPTSWHASVDFNGTPGGDDSILFTGVATADEDGDGFNAFLEYALGSDDGSSSSLPSLSLDREASDGLDDFFTVSFRINLAAVGLQYSLQGSNDLISWTGEKEMTHVATDHNGDGTATMKFRSTSPVNAVFAERFYRIHVEGRE
ncbi:lamin tail domain-containing protein, partial [Akkermansiaceae bacterium]|nr:lamin tail domain-containing protein [Akkermansiaceae bacterium]